MRTALAAVQLAAWVLLGLLVAGVSHAQTVTGDFDYSTQVNGDGTLTPTLTWSTVPEATYCEATGESEWAGRKAGAGAQTLPTFPTTTPKAWALVCHWPGTTQAMLTWTPSTHNTDGTALTDLAGYRANWGTSPTELTQSAQIADPSATSYTVTELTAGQWYFSLKAYTTRGMESDQSNIVNRTLSGPIEWSHSVGAKKPQAPVLE